jgi:acetyl-CoA acyltransferase
MREVVVLGVGMTRFGKHPDKGLKELGTEAIWNAVEDANIPPKDIPIIYVANAMGQQLTELRGTIAQHVVSHAGFLGMPVINVENACSGGSTALRGCILEVASGNYDVAMAVGVEKMCIADTARSAAAMAFGTILGKFGFMFVGLYAMNLRRLMEKYGLTREHFAKVVVKNTKNGALNPYAQFRQPRTMEEILNSRVVSDPLTLLMCSTMADGAAAAIVTTREKAAKYSSKTPISIAACELVSGTPTSADAVHVPIETRASRQAYEKAGIGPEDIDVVECHDAMAPAELLIYEELGLCGEGEAGRWIDEGKTEINGVIAVNPSGGLASKGHPVSATGLAQVSEIVWQLRGEAGERQVPNAKIGVTENAGGWVMDDNAACAITILKK